MYQKNLGIGTHTLQLKSRAQNTQIEGTHNILLMYDKALLKLVHCCPKAVKCQRQFPAPRTPPSYQQTTTTIITPNHFPHTVIQIFLAVNKSGEGSECRESHFENALGEIMRYYNTKFI